MLKHYVYNVSYDESTGTDIATIEHNHDLNVYVQKFDNKEVPVPFVVPNWSKAYLVKVWPADFPAKYPGNGFHDKDFFIVPQNGYIWVKDCYTASDYWILVNGVTAYHKCGASFSSNVFFAVRQGDVLTMREVMTETYWERNLRSFDEHNLHDSTVMFIPAEFRSTVTQ